MQITSYVMLINYLIVPMELYLLDEAWVLAWAIMHVLA
jgi:hypothetical protein